MDEAIVEHLGDLKDLYLAEQEVRAFEAGRSATLPLSDVMKCYGMGN